MLRKKVIAANWKMNGSLSQNQVWLEQFVEEAPQVNAVEWVVLPPYLYLDTLLNKLSDLTSVSVGAQNISQFDDGAYTGEISGRMLSELGGRYVLVGHSERRSYFAESNQIVAQKFQKALQHNLKPILCVGETQAERAANQTMSVIEQQLAAVVEMNGIQTFAYALIAYEPVWAIGTGNSATPQQAEEVHVMIRKWLEQRDAKIAQTISILYGGSVNAANATSLFAMANIDGALVGGASLKAKEFVGIGRCIN